MLAHARARDDELVDQDRDVYAYLADRGLMPAWEHDVVGILDQSMPLPPALHKWPADGWRLVAPLGDVTTADVVGLQACCVRPGEPRYASYGRVGRTAFLNEKARQLIERGQRSAIPILVLRDMLDFLAGIVAVGDELALVAAPRAVSAATPIDSWVSGARLVVAVDDAGEAAVRQIAQAAYAQGATAVARLSWPPGCRDACHVLAQGGALALGSMIQEAAA